MLSDYQDILHKKLLKYNGENEELTKTIERSIQNVYLAPFDFHGDGVINVPFRVNAEHYDEFTYIHDKKLKHYDTSFSSYIRNLLIEYATKTEYQREYMFQHEIMENLRIAIKDTKLCNFYTNNGKLSFYPISIEITLYDRQNIIVGLTEKKESVFAKLYSVKKIIIEDTAISVSDNDCEKLYAEYRDFCESEEI
jgi:hypothetical protein